MQNEKFSFVCLNPDLLHSKRNSNCEFQVPTSEEKEFQNLKHYMWGLHPYGKTNPYLTSTRNLWIAGQCMLGRFKKRVSSKRYSAKYLSMSFGGYLSHSTRQPVYDPKKFQVSEALCSSWWLRSSSVPHWSHVYYGSLEVLWFQIMDTKSAVGDEPFQWLIKSLTFS